MTRKHSTKRTLIASILVLCLCLTSFIGTTFAWFTDSVTSGGNIIKSGKLDVAMYWANGDEAVPTDKTGWTDASTGAIFDYDKWEPGYTEARHIKIANEGTLALKYQLAIIPNGEVSKLADVIDVYYADPAAQIADRTALTDSMKIGTLADVLADMSTMTGELLKGENHTVTLALVMQKDAGNEYQELSIGTDFSVRLLATQLAAENDSFGDDYDDDAWAEGMAVYTASDLQAAINAGENVTLMNDIELTESIVIPAPAASTMTLRAAAPVAQIINLNGKNITIAAAYDDAAATASSAIVNNGSVFLRGTGTVKATNNYTVRNYGKMVIDGITVENGIMNFADLTVESGNISNSRTGKHAIYGNAATLTINGGTFYNDNPGNATIFSYAGEVEINDGEFSIADGTATLGWTSCLIDAQGNAKYTINGGVINGEIRDYNKNTTVFGGIFAHNSVKNFVASGFKAVESNGTYYIVSDTVAGVIASPADLAALGGTKINGTYELMADLDMSGTAMKSMEVSGGASVIFNGNGHTISGLTLTAAGIHGMTGAGEEAAGLFDLSAPATTVSLTVNNLAFENATVECSGRAAVVVGYNSNGGTIITLNNVDVKGATVNSDTVAALVGYTTGKVFLTDCDVEDIALTGEAGRPDKVGALVGTANTATCEVTTQNCKNNTDYPVFGRVINGAKWNGGTPISTTAQLIDAIKAAPVGETTTLYLVNGNYDGDIKITLADLGVQGGDVIIKALDGATPVITGTVTLGYRNQGTGATMYNANVTFDGITFNHANDETHSFDVQDVKSLNLINCTIIGDGEYGLTSARGNATGTSKITGCTLENAGMQLLGNFATGLVIEGCTFNDSCINVQAGNSVTVQKCTFNKTLTEANVDDSFYAIRSNSTPITVNDCKINIDSELTDVATSQAKWYLLANRGTTNWTVTDVAVTLTEAALKQTELKITACTSSGLINCTNLTVNGVEK